MNQLEKLIELFDKSIALSSKKKHRLGFDEEVGILKEKSKLIFCIKKMLIIKDKKTNKYKIINEIVKITEEEFVELEKYFKNDKETACLFLNNKELNCLQDLHTYFSYFTCGICSTNNIKSIRTNILQSSKINIIYEVTFSQSDNISENLIGNIGVFTTTEDYFEKNKYHDLIEFETIF